MTRLLSEKEEKVQTHEGELDKAGREKKGLIKKARSRMPGRMKPVRMGRMTRRKEFTVIDDGNQLLL